jgi:hypothetical protein
MTIPPINHASARDLAALLYSFDNEDEAMKAAAITVRAIIDGRDRLGLTRDDALRSPRTTSAPPWPSTIGSAHDRRRCTEETRNA